MLSDARYEAALPCSDLERAKSFYADKLGLTPAESSRRVLSMRDATVPGSCCFPVAATHPGSHSQMGFIVADADAEVRDLKQRGVQFEEYDFPGFDKATSIAQIGEDRGPGSKTVKATGRESFSSGSG